MDVKTPLNVIREVCYGTGVLTSVPVRQDKTHLLAASLLEMKPPGI